LIDDCGKFGYCILLKNIKDKFSFPSIKNREKEEPEIKNKKIKMSAFIYKCDKNFDGMAQ
jgi:hypothetical protein